MGDGKPATKGAAKEKTTAKDKVPAKSTVKTKAPAKAAAKKQVLLSGGNPQIAKAEGEAPVQAYIAALSGSRQEICRRLDALIEETVPGVARAVKWNSPFYGVAGQGWFLSFHVFTRYVKVTFFKGTELEPAPAGGTAKEARWIDLREGEAWDEAQMAAWIKQAAAFPGWMA
ncbi:hypothetical protein GCM10007301_37330 [Azorhizobium oxalatiphilum]|uniref:YdhG-like domain-containing protein n=1 Tax=Azorhizobium oxalatiphilum TaxID=980631 RepID=A0A917C7B2_9HYPH|nr:DUF1801 domain-containing protein [Azorhizobium oxalatiphilum]GGF74049.1 hypothetical protein GCM10007301_37330 [Azorhizobium oxalatiphilum]